MRISYSIPIFSKNAAACAITGISESLPITIPTFAIAPSLLIRFTCIISALFFELNPNFYLLSGA